MVRQMTENIFRVKIVKTGESWVPGPEVYRMSGWDSWELLHFHMVLAYNRDTNFLINTGLPEDLTERNNAMVRFAGERAKFISLDSVDILKKMGFPPDSIENISFTPIQDYTTGRADMFNRATYHILKKGWIDDIVVPGEHNAERNLFVPERILQYLDFVAHRRIRYFDAESITELVPGIDALWVGCHHRASLAFIINTSGGKVVFTDAAFKKNNIRNKIPMGIAENIFECYSAYRAMERYGRILPAYDPDITGMEF